MKPIEWAEVLLKPIEWAEVLLKPIEWAKARKNSGSRDAEEFFSNSFFVHTPYT